MPKDPSDDDFPIDPPRRERRAPGGAPGSLRWARGLLGRPLALERRGRQLHVVLGERRRSPAQIRAEALAALGNELDQRLAEIESPSARMAMRHLSAVRHALVHKGWSGVAYLPSRVLAKAEVQARMIAGNAGSARMQAFLEQLVRLRAAAAVREDRVQQQPPEAGAGAVEVIETTQEAFAASALEWAASTRQKEDPA